MQIELTFNEAEIGKDRLDVLRREAIHQRLPVDELIKLEVLSMADALIAAAKRKPRRQHTAAA